MITRQKLEEKQIVFYVITFLISAFVGLSWPGSAMLQNLINPIIAVLLYSMFCQIPFFELKNAFRNRAFFKALLVGNFLIIPLFVWGLVTVFPTIPIIKLGVLLVLLTPCIDYVIVFSHLGKGDSKATLASTPLLFLFQLLLLPLYLGLFLGAETLQIIDLEPLFNAFLYLIVVPFLLSLLTQISARSNPMGEAVLNFSSWLPVPFMALTFFVVIGSQIRGVAHHPQPVSSVVPIYVMFAVIAPFIGILSARLFKVGREGSRAIAFSTSTRNSLVVLPLALSLPSPDHQWVAVVIVTQTIVELFFELIYIQVIPRIT